MHDGAVPAMYMVIKGEKPEEYEGDRSADAMARFIGDKIGGYNRMKGGKKQRKQSGGVGGEPCHAGADSCRPNDSDDDSECESYMELQHLGPDVLLSQYEVCDAEPSVSSAPVASKPAAILCKHHNLILELMIMYMTVQVMIWSRYDRSHVKLNVEIT